MLDWFEKDAPIRLKFKVLLIVQATLAAIGFAISWAGYHGYVSSGLENIVSITVLVATVGSIALASNRICTPYVNTVLRMEALAAGDTATPIMYTDYKDCVGRMTKAMATFRDNAVEVEQAREAQDRIVRELSDGLDKLGQNVLDYRIEEAFPGAYDSLRQNYNAALQSLGDTVRSVRSSAAAALNGASEIRAASDDLALRNEQQAASLEETAAAMNQVTEAVKETANSAAEVRHTITEAHHQATEGGEVVQRAIGAMAEIERSSQEINQIISVIDGIAFQTNLLALNAGVEAARAGDAGKGFAVVANEVRALAQRSADAAKDIKTLITASTEKVGEGVGLVGETGELLSKIVARVGEISGLVTAIADSAQQQASNLQSVNTAVGDMDRMTQQNAAMVEQSTAAARSLADEANELTDIVARFSTGDGAQAVVTLPSFARPKRAAASFVAPPVTGNLAVQVTSGGSDDDWTEF